MRVASWKVRVDFANCELKNASCELKSISWELQTAS